MDDPSRSTVAVPTGADALLGPYLKGERGAKLRSQLRRLHPDASRGEIEDAIQTACDRFLRKADGITEQGQIYAWLRTTAHRELLLEDDHRKRLVVVNPANTLETVATDDLDPETEAIAHEDEADLAALVQEVSASLSPRKRDVLALYGAGWTRPEIASRLGIRDRVVKRDLVEIMDEARSAIARKAGGGCERGEPLVLRFAYGLASAGEVEQARRHMTSCRRCAILWERLDAWREKVGALLPVSAVEQASPGFLERVAHRTVDAFATVKQHVLGGASQVKQQAVAATTNYRPIDPTPFAGAKPGPTALAIVSCLTIAGGGAAYCANNDVDPIGAAAGFIAGTQSPSQPESSSSPEGSESTAIVPQAPSPASEETPPTEEVAPQPVESEPDPKPEPEPEPPPPEASFEPSSPNYPASESTETDSYESEPAPAAATPAPAAGGGTPQFGGP